ncbi:MAG: histidine kinase [Firmicutes bacterium]|nr:histidine kinase [Bacillota bacterium]
MDNEYQRLDAKFAQSLVDIVAAELNKNVNILDDRGVVIASFSKERIGQVHEPGAMMLKSGVIKEFYVTKADELRFNGVRTGFNMPIMFENKCVGVIGVTGELKTSEPYARLAARFVEANLQSNARQEKLVGALKEKEELQFVFLNKIIRVQEEERKRISRELHDETSQSLTSIIVGLRVLAEQVKGSGEREKILHMRDLARTTLEAVHDMAVELRPVLLDDLGLVAAAQKYIANYSKQYNIVMHVEFNNLSRERFATEVEIALYRILQEGLTNIVKHAKATEVWVSLYKTQTKLILMINDNGVGFNLELFKSTHSRTSLGIYGMSERVALVEGIFDIKSAVGQGTKIFVEIPL